MRNKVESIHILSAIVLMLGITVSAAGLFYTAGGGPHDFVNQYGDTVKIYGYGLYSNDSYFKAPISRGTDFTVLFFAVPALVVALLLDIKKRSIKTKMFQMSVISIFAYYSASMALGVTYNILHLVYIALFSSSLFALIILTGSLNSKQFTVNAAKFPYKGLYIFLAFTGIVLIIAWLPDIISSLVEGRSLALIEIYTTEITYVLDMGIIGPASLICLLQLKQRKNMGYIMSVMLLTLCTAVGIMVPAQTIFQWAAGISLPLPAILTKAGSFVVLALFALYFYLKIIKVKFDQEEANNSANPENLYI